MGYVILLEFDEKECIIMKGPKISVIVPVYNVSEYISRCADSIVSQKLYDIEIIFVNDGSKDN